MVLASAAHAATVPGLAEVSAAHAGYCEAQNLNAARIRQAKCKVIPEEGTEYKCRYLLPETDGSWKKYTAYIAQDGGKWVWLDGETRCYSELEQFH
jgi:hypothetical protein